MGNSLSRFKFIALLEGWSFIVLLFVAMPLKYWFDIPMAVKTVGMAHGLLFVLYYLALLPAISESKWTTKFKIWAIIAAFLPFATLHVEYKLRAPK
jgi:integral membrane protein